MKPPVFDKPVTCETLTALFGLQSLCLGQLLSKRLRYDLKISTSYANVRFAFTPQEQEVVDQLMVAVIENRNLAFTRIVPSKEVLQRLLT